MRRCASTHGYLLRSRWDRREEHADALASDGVEEIFKMGQGDTTQVDLFDPTNYLLTYLPSEDRQDQAAPYENQMASAATRQSDRRAQKSRQAEGGRLFTTVHNCFPHSASIPRPR